MAPPQGHALDAIVFDKAKDPTHRYHRPGAGHVRVPGFPHPVLAAWRARPRNFPFNTCPLGYERVHHQKGISAPRSGKYFQTLVEPSENVVPAFLYKHPALCCAPCKAAGRTCIQYDVAFPNGSDARYVLAMCWDCRVKGLDCSLRFRDLAHPNGPPVLGTHAFTARSTGRLPLIERRLLQGAATRVPMHSVAVVLLASPSPSPKPESRITARTPIPGQSSVRATYLVTEPPVRQAISSAFDLSVDQKFELIEDTPSGSRSTPSGVGPIRSQRTPFPSSPRRSPYTPRQSAKVHDYAKVMRPWAKPKKTPMSTPSRNAASFRPHGIPSATSPMRDIIDCPTPSSRKKRPIPVIDLTLTPPRKARSKVKKEDPAPLSDEIVIADLQSQLWQTRARLRASEESTKKVETDREEALESRDRMEGLLKAKNRECLQMTYDLAKARRATSMAGPSQTASELGGLMTPSSTPQTDTKSVSSDRCPSTPTPGAAGEDHEQLKRQISLLRSDLAASHSAQSDLRAMLKRSQTEREAANKEAAEQKARADSMKALWVSAESRAELAMKEVLRRDGNGA